MQRVKPENPAPLNYATPRQRRMSQSWLFYLVVVTPIFLTAAGLLISLAGYVSRSPAVVAPPVTVLTQGTIALPQTPWRLTIPAGTWQQLPQPILKHRLLTTGIKSTYVLTSRYWFTR